MKELYAFLIFFTAFFSLNAQVCLPDSSILDSMGIIRPLPYDSTTNTGGIDQVACIGQPFELVFTAAIPETIELFGFQVPLNYAEFDTAGAIQNLPEGLDYSCNPPNCRFVPNTLGCIIVEGTPTGLAMDHNLILTANVSTSIGTGPQTLPGVIAPGEYILKVRDSSDPECMTSSINDQYFNFENASLIPNPTLNNTSLTFTLNHASKIKWSMHNLYGQLLYDFDQNLPTGNYSIPLMTDKLKSGFYLIRITDGKTIKSLKLIKQ